MARFFSQHFRTAHARRHVTLYSTIAYGELQAMSSVSRGSDSMVLSARCIPNMPVGAAQSGMGICGAKRRDALPVCHTPPSCTMSKPASLKLQGTGGTRQEVRREEDKQDEGKRETRERFRHLPVDFRLREVIEARLLLPFLQLQLMDDDPSHAQRPQVSISRRTVQKWSKPSSLSMFCATFAPLRTPTPSTTSCRKWTTKFYATATAITVVESWKEEGRWGGGCATTNYTHKSSRHTWC
eukprot:979736-Rhodomonas_salina.1